MNIQFLDEWCNVNPTPCPFCPNTIDGGQIEFYNIFDHLMADHFNPHGSIINRSTAEIVSAILKALSHKLDDRQETLTDEIASLKKRLNQIEKNLASRYYWDKRGHTL